MPPKLVFNDLSYLNDTGFVPIDKYKSKLSSTPYYREGADQCFSGVGWVANDSTSLDALKSTRMCLGSVPMNSKISKRSIYSSDSQTERYKSYYKYYNDLPGQIQYYVDPNSSNPFSPHVLFAATVVIDPMDTATRDFQILSKPGMCLPLSTLCSSIGELRDIQSHREDMLAYATKRTKKHDFTPIYFNF